MPIPLSASQALAVPKVDPQAAAQAQSAGQAFRSANWYNGGTTATPTTESQNLANVYNSGLDPSKPVIPTPYIQGVLGQAAKDTAAQGIAASAVTPKPLGAVPNTAMSAASTGSSVPKFDSAGIAASKIAAKRAALAASVSAYNTSRKQNFDYTNQINQENRTLRDAMFHETNNPFAGKYQYDKTNMLRNDGIVDTQDQMQYNSDIAAENQKLADFDAGAPGMQQDLQQQLDQQQFQNNIAQAGVTGQYNGSPTLAAQGQQFNQGIAQAGLTGNYTSPQTASIQQQMAANSAAYANASPQEQIRLHNENLALGQQLGQTYDPGTGTYSGGNTSTRTLAGQTLDMNNAKDMAALTGYMPNGQPTNAKQQQDLGNLWTAAEQTGTIPNQLADFYGLPHGMQTQAAKTSAAQLAISQQNANNSSRSTTASINNMNADNTRADNAVKLSADQRNFAGDVQTELSQAKSKDDVVNFFNANAGEITKQLGSDAFTKMKNDALAQYDKVTPSDKQDQSVRDKAIAAAQKDFRWDAKGTDKNALIKEYEAYYN